MDDDDRGHTRFVAAKLAAKLTGLTEGATRKRTERGIWLKAENGFATRSAAP